VRSFPAQQVVLRAGVGLALWLPNRVSSERGSCVTIGSEPTWIDLGFELSPNGSFPATGPKPRLPASGRPVPVSKAHVTGPRRRFWVEGQIRGEIDARLISKPVEAFHARVQYRLSSPGESH